MTGAFLDCLVAAMGIWSGWNADSVGLAFFSSCAFFFFLGFFDLARMMTMMTADDKTSTHTVHLLSTSCYSRPDSLRHSSARPPIVPIATYGLSSMKASGREGAAVVVVVVVVVVVRVVGTGVVGPSEATPRVTYMYVYNVYVLKVFL